MTGTEQIRIISLLGWSDSGKTGLAVELIEECRRRGLSCGAAKATRHPGDFEPPAKDSSRFRAAGASPVAFIGTGETGLSALYLPTPPLVDRAWLRALFPDCRYLVAEGLEVEGAWRILVESGPEGAKRNVDEVEALVSPDPDRRAAFAAAGKPAFAHHEAGAIIDLLEETWTGR